MVKSWKPRAVIESPLNYMGGLCLLSQPSAKDPLTVNGTKGGGVAGYLPYSLFQHKKLRFAWAKNFFLSPTQLKYWRKVFLKYPFPKFHRKT